MNTTTKMTMLVRRELWENRSLWIAPLVVAGVILFAAAFGGIHGGPDDEYWVGWGADRPPPESLDLGPEKLRKIYAGTMIGFSMVHLMTLAIVVFFYLLDSLLTERKDRSILFWKSLPISDAQVVSSKVLTAVVLAPLYVLVISALTQLAFGAIWWMRGDEGLPGALLLAWDAGTWGTVQAAFLAMVPAVILWYLPLAGYLMLVSVWARKNAFLWAVLPPAALLLVEGLLMHSNHVGDFLGRRLAGPFQIMASDHDHSDDIATLADVTERVGRVFTHYETWIGVLVGVAMLLAVIRIRRYRDDS